MLVAHGTAAAAATPDCCWLKAQGLAAVAAPSDCWWLTVLKQPNAIELFRIGVWLDRQKMKTPEEREGGLTSGGGGGGRSTAWGGRADAERQSRCVGERLGMAWRCVNYIASQKQSKVCVCECVCVLER